MKGGIIVMKIEAENSSALCVLILSDRLIDNAQKLADYLTSTGIQVVALATSKEQALMFCDDRVDFLIIAGYLKNRQNYGIIEECRNRRLYAIPVIWAMQDSLISSHCSMYRIPLRFERTLPMCDFMLFLQLNRPSHIALPYEEKQAIQQNCKPTDKHKEVIISRIRTFLQHCLFP
jgi:hypothetical protein